MKAQPFEKVIPTCPFCGKAIPKGLKPLTPPFGYTCDGRVIDAKGNVLEAEQKTNTNDMSLNDEPSAT